MTPPAADGPDPLDVDPAQAELNADLFESYAKVAVNEIALLPTETRWEAEVDAASAYRTAAQWALLVDPERARRLLMSAAQHFSSTYGYAAFLRAVAGAMARDVLADSRQLLILNPPPPTEEKA